MYEDIAASNCPNILRMNLMGHLAIEREITVQYIKKASERIIFAQILLQVVFGTVVFWIYNGRDR
jgi:hypothetical protein